MPLYFKAATNQTAVTAARRHISVTPDRRMRRAAQIPDTDVMRP
jgi:hypothetical protein